MDAVKFLKERKRLCQMYEVCGSCPACRASGGCIFSVTNGATPEEQSEFMEEWSATNPRKTRQAGWLPVYESEITGWDPALAGRDPIGGYACSKCGYEAVYDCNDEYVLSDYCPGCGARMAGGAK